MLRPTVVLLGLLAASPAFAQGAKRVYISVDMEGLSGVSGDDQLSPSGAEYQRSRKLMAADTNAAIEGAFAGGATEVVVNDSHGFQRNLLPEDLDPRARLITHTFKRHGMMEGFDDTFDAVIFVGYHVKAGAPRGLFAHTGSGVVADLTINDVSVGEGGLNAALASWYGVPVVAVSGDDAAVAEVLVHAPDAKGAVVKRAINSRASVLEPLAKAREAIRTAATEGVRTARKRAPLRQPTYRVTLRYRNVAHPEVATAFREIERLAPDTVAFTRDSMPDAYRLIRVLYRFLTPD